MPDTRLFLDIIPELTESSGEDNSVDQESQAMTSFLSSCGADLFNDYEYDFYRPTIPREDEC